jgi:hypothetical protein
MIANDTEELTTNNTAEEATLDDADGTDDRETLKVSKRLVSDCSPESAHCLG